MADEAKRAMRVVIVRLVGGTELIGRVGEMELLPGQPKPEWIPLERALGLRLQAGAPGTAEIVFQDVAAAAKRSDPGKPAIDLMLAGSAIAFHYEPTARLAREYSAVTSGLVLHA